jgi:nitrite reductase (cytochrome c-552)
MRNTAMDALVSLVNDIRTAKAAGATDEQLAAARTMQRRGQFLLDFIEAENSMGFHASQEAMRVLALSLDNTRQGQVVLREATGIRTGANTAPAFQIRRPVPPSERAEPPQAGEAGKQ